jgi:predicted alpha/beta-fold hydrolase
MEIWEMYKSLLVLYNTNKNLEANIKRKMKNLQTSSDTPTNLKRQDKRIKAIVRLYKEKFPEGWDRG